MPDRQTRGHPIVDPPMEFTTQPVDQPVERAERRKIDRHPPPALPGFIGHMTPSDSRADRRPQAPLRPQPSPNTGLPQLPGSPFQHAVPTTPMYQSGASVGCFPLYSGLPVSQAGRRP
jgi:hypothetical protein